MKWNARRLPIGLILIILSLALMGAPSCDDDDDDGADDDDSSPVDDDNDTLPPDDDSDDDDDNDTAPDDDIDDDSDDDGDDDDDSDDDSDDDVDDDTTPSADDRLVLLGSTADEYAAWTQTADGWDRQTIPAPTVDEDTQLLRGPVLIVDGQYGYSLWNFFFNYDNLDIIFYTTGNRWLSYDRTNGWRATDELAPAQAMRYVEWIGRPSGDTLWANARFMWFLFIPLQPEVSFANMQLLHYDGATPQVVFDGDDSGIYAIDLPTASTGMLQMYYEGARQTLTYDGVQWSDYALPAGFADAWLMDLSLDESLDGYVVYQQNDVYWVGEIADGAWTQIAMPAGCLLPERATPQYLARHGDHVVAFELHKDTRFLEKRDGQWHCRSFETDVTDLYVRNAIAYGDDTVYVAADRKNNTFGGRVLRFNPDGYEELTLPAELEHLWGVYMTGPTAPPRQFIVGEHYRLY